MSNPQWSEALALANRTRSEGVAVKRAVNSGELSVADALRDPRAGSLTVEALLAAQRHWGRHRVRKFLSRVRLNGFGLGIINRRVRDLPERAIDIISRELDSG